MLLAWLLFVCGLTSAFALLGVYLVQQFLNVDELAMKLGALPTRSIRITIRAAILSGILIILMILGGMWCSVILEILGTHGGA
ncbi:hypothetical protein [Myceligenerans xiligouense]|uniref:Uncharacterized protein n=1 Tax=Myceligenerans xiligouense TaxID=253184 RepID=A0A3N4YM37_9MICO|nr:hypothetical protein [Myceligenerans xiligouense]RPF20384.1 hypothetical protein EDD34_0975 [Myceligenerans xiligouense]